MLQRQWLQEPYPTSPQLTTRDDIWMLCQEDVRPETTDTAFHCGTACIPFLEDRDVVPDQDGVLRKILEISYPPEGLTSDTLESWAACESRPRNWLHHSVLTTNGPGRQARLGLTARSHGQADWNWPVLRRVSVSEWLEALTSSADSDQEKVQASKSAIRTSTLLPAHLPGYGGLGKIVLTTSGDWVEVDPESIFLGGGSSTAPVSLVHTDLQNDPHTLAALRELGIGPVSPEVGLKQAVSAWEYGKSEFPKYGYASLPEYDSWMNYYWGPLSKNLPPDTVKQLRERSSQQSYDSILFNFLAEGQDTIPNYDSWMSQYWALFWQLTREVDPQEAADIIRSPGQTGARFSQFALLTAVGTY